ncbi:MAG: hypothetical protein P4L64_17730 [Caulobacteraceae bacterium]|nr:hypothetical protein [Caulobacteraceae bacterium]
MGLGFWIQLAGSAVAIALLVAFAAWARIERPCPPLDEVAARALLAEEFPGRNFERLWIPADRRGVVARSGNEALILFRAGDGYVARSLGWTEAAHTAARDGRLQFRLEDVGAPVASFLAEGAAPWPPGSEARA